MTGNNGTKVIIKAPKVGDYIHGLGGVLGIIYKVHPLGTVDAKVPGIGQCFRVTGLPLLDLEVKG